MTYNLKKQRENRKGWMVGSISITAQNPFQGMLKKKREREERG